MGLYDRDYGHSNYEGSYGPQPGLHLGSPKSVVVKLMIFNAIVFVLQLLFRAEANPQLSWFDMLFSLQGDWFREPWRVFEFLTYGFMHNPWNFWHILGNMFMLWMFGTSVEERFGSKEFLWFYLTSIVFAAICWNITEIASSSVYKPMLGASGGVSAVILLSIFLNPRRTIFFNLLFPIPVWVFGIFLVAQDMWGAVSRSGNVAFTAHLGGFLFAYLYFSYRIRLTDYLPVDFNFKLPSFKRRPNLKVHRPTDDDEDATERRLNELLDKVKEVGQDNLTKSEQRELQKLSKHYQRKHS